MGKLRRAILPLLFLTLLLLGQTAPSNAQSRSPNYWQYPASGRLQHVITSDVDHDSINEFIVVDENGQVDLLSSNGALQWSYTSQDQVLSIGTIKVDDSGQLTQEIALGSRNRLMLLSASGDINWQIDLTNFDIPLSLVTSGDSKAVVDLSSQYEAIPVAVAPMDYDNNGNDEILVLMQSGHLHLFDNKGSLLWRYANDDSNPEADTQPRMFVGDIEGDGQSEIALGLFDPRLRFSQLMIVGRNGEAKWDQNQSISGRITALTPVKFGEGEQQYIAVGNNLGQINLYDAGRRRLWQRTLNKPITTLVAAHVPDGTGLVAGTNIGSVVAFNREGRRTWARYLAPDANRRIVALSATPLAPSENQPSLAAIVESVDSDSEPADVVILASNGRTLNTFPTVDTSGLTRLTDINKDNNSELLLARFSQVELLGLGLGASETAKGWDYNLFSEPQSVLVLDLDQDGIDELLIGTQDGRIHSLDNNKSIRWLHAPGGAITHLAAQVNSSSEPPGIVAVRNDTLLGPGNQLIFESWVELRQANGKQLWEQQLSTQITALAVGELNSQGRPEIIIGTSRGDVIVYSASGNLMWKASISGTVEHLLILEENSSRPPRLIAATANQIFDVSRQSTPWRFATYKESIHAIYQTSQPGRDLTSSILVFLVDGTVHSRIVSRGVQRPYWILDLQGNPTSSLPRNETIDDPLEGEIADSFIFSTDTSHLLHLMIEDNLPTISWQLDKMEEITSLYWSDLDGDMQPEMAVGNEKGTVRLYRVRSSNEPVILANLDLSSRVFALTALHNEADQKSDLLAVTENGLVQLFRAQENWPPLLTSPGVEATPNQYSIVVSVQDVENDDVMVRLDIRDPASGRWMTQEEKQLSRGNGTLFWFVDDPPVSAEGVSYRFHFDDGFHQGYVNPPFGPAAISVQPPVGLSPAYMGFLGTVLLLIAIILVRQSQLPATRARRFYRRLKQQTSLTLTLLENKYANTAKSPDFLLYLANQARQRGDSLIASLADGLYLLTDQPHAGLPIIISVLEDSVQEGCAWQDIERWQMIYDISYALLEAPTVTELTLLRPQLAQLLSDLDETNHWSPILDSLLPILTNLRDSERVELAADRLVYLNEAAMLLHRSQEHMPELSMKIEKSLVTAITNRWSALVSAEIEDLRGRAELAITLKTKRLAPNEQLDVVIEVINNGRAAAENLIAQLDSEPAYNVHSPPQVISYLPPGRVRQVQFTIEPKVSDRFRIALTMSYDDRNQRDKTIAFGDMVHLLPPERDFKPIANPYLPGTPLRRNSSIFYGRKDLFNFIADNASDLTQRNVLILVGERRTGKTSVLLRLEEHLPKNILPVYIDCQSLGVIPGMPALLHDLSWYIADALAAQGIDIDVPDPAEWQKDPTGRFQRIFLPKVQSLLAEGTTLLLVFDEFEAFESLVDDGILPPTLFPYLRHLMQHSGGLSFVFVGTRHLEEMSADYWSVLFNIALYQRISYLSKESATQLICEPVMPNLIYDDLALDKILRVTTGHPYFLQLVCYTLVKRANAQRTGYATISDVNAAVDEMLRLGEVHFAYLWQRSTQIERTLLTTMAHLIDRDVPFHPADLLQYLEPYGIHLNPAEVTVALDRLVERNILREVTEEAVTLYELKIGLVGLWVARYKSLSTLLTGNGEQRTTMSRKA